MSQLLQAPGATLIAENDPRLTPVFSLPAAPASSPGRSWLAGVDYLSGWWPRSGMLGESGVDVPLLAAQRYEPPEITRGTNSRFGFPGVTRDVYGSAVGGCTVKCFRTSTDELVNRVVSDALSGQFVASTPYYPDAHYLVSTKTGSPDVQGVTVNTLIGA